MKVNEIQFNVLKIVGIHLMYRISLRMTEFTELYSNEWKVTKAFVNYL